MESKAHVSLPVVVTINDRFGDNSDTETNGSARTSTVILVAHWSIACEPVIVQSHQHYPQL